MSVYVDVKTFKDQVGSETKAHDTRIYGAVYAATEYIHSTITNRLYPGYSKMYPYMGAKVFDALTFSQSPYNGILSEIPTIKSGDAFQMALYGGTGGRRGLNFRKNEFIGAPTITIAQGDTIIADDFLAYPLNDLCKNEIRLRMTSSKSWYSSAPESAISVSEVAWVKRVEQTDGWFNTGVTAGVLDASALTLTTSEPAVISTGHILRLDDEIVNVASVEGNTVTLAKRGDNGTTAATHIAATAIYAYAADKIVKDATITLARLFLKKPGALTTFPQSGAVVSEDAEYINRATSLLKPYILGAWG